MRALRLAPPDPDSLIERCGPLVWALCRRLDPQPEDAWQEIWEKVLRALPGFDPAGSASVSTWITRIAHRHLVDRHRRRVVRGEAVPPDDLADPGPSTPDLLAHRGGLARLEEAIARLPEAQRRVVVLHHLHEAPLDEIAAAEGVPAGTIKSRLHRARAQLLEWLQ